MKEKMRILLALLVCMMILCPVASFADSEEVPEGSENPVVADKQPASDEQTPVAASEPEAPKEEASSPDIEKTEGENVSDEPKPETESTDVSNETGEETGVKEPSTETSQEPLPEVSKEPSAIDKLTERIANWDCKSRLDIEDLKIPASDEFLVSGLVSEVYDDAFIIETADGFVVAISVDLGSEDSDESEDEQGGTVAASGSDTVDTGSSMVADEEIVDVSEGSGDGTVISESMPVEEFPISEDAPVESVGALLTTMSVMLAGVARILHALI